jgi:hypothetical protein
MKLDTFMELKYFFLKKNGGISIGNEKFTQVS